MDQTNDLALFKKEICIYALVTAAIFEIISIPIAGIGIEFAYGLCLGTAAAIVNFSVMAFTFSRMAETKSTGITVLGYVVRMAIYAAVFFVALKAGLTSTAGAVAGALTVKIAIYYLHVVRRKKK